MRVTLSAFTVLAVAAALARAEAPAAKPAEVAKAAAPAVPPGPPVPPKEIDQLKFFHGDWSCEGQEPDSPWGKAHKTKTTATVHPDLDGFWVSGRIEQEKTAENAHP